MLCLLPLLIVYLRQTSSMLSEKEKKIRETMKIMGMTSFNYYVTWFIRYFAVYVVIHIICSAILVKNFSHISFGVVLITFLLFDLLLIVQSCFIQVFFTRAKMGMVIALLFFVLQYIVNFIIRNSDNPTYQQNLYGSISPHSAFALAMQELVYAQSVAINLNFGQLTTVINYYSISTAWLSFVIHIVFWLLLTMYLEQVFPNEWGAKKHPLFCFNWMWRNKEH
jgi:ATP-binding cassette subfamily A (ABC1) protein 3